MTKPSKTFAPNEVIIELLGKRTISGVKPDFGNFTCPFTGSTCIKKSVKVSQPHYPVCSISPKTSDEVVTICPRRFYSRNFIKDITEHAWPGSAPKNPKIAYEVQMSGFGTIDFVIADVSTSGVDAFVSCEIQAVDITGSVSGFFTDYVEGKIKSEIPSDKIGQRNYSFGFNRKNVAKRYLSQLIYKGHHHQIWGSRIVALVQKSMYDYFQSQASFKTDKNIGDPQSSVVFLIYDYVFNDITQQYELKIVDTQATSHNALQNANMYIEPPKKSDFEAKILSRIRRNPT
ncbi:NotI family restriction endonuclease [Hellea balneolensis]|uniref:NotI family restriction endonuclease n=1 Tax=Hellea balneolensis TaxID=287478 RepID=UPI00041083DA|nr:NotI family restriction endonuclease [Hellea balneolensis]